MKHLAFSFREQKYNFSFKLLVYFLPPPTSNCRLLIHDPATDRNYLALCTTQSTELITVQSTQSYTTRTLFLNHQSSSIVYKLDLPHIFFSPLLPSSPLLYPPLTSEQRTKDLEDFLALRTFNLRLSNSIFSFILPLNPYKHAFTYTSCRYGSNYFLKTKVNNKCFILLKYTCKGLQKSISELER